MAYRDIWESPGGLWTERSQAAADRYARYWPGDPMSPILLEDTASLTASTAILPE